MLRLEVQYMTLVKTDPILGTGLRVRTDSRYWPWFVGKCYQGLRAKGLKSKRRREAASMVSGFLKPQILLFEGKVLRNLEGFLNNQCRFKMVLPPFRNKKPMISRVVTPVRKYFICRIGFLFLQCQTPQLHIMQVPQIQRTLDKLAVCDGQFFLGR